MGRQLLGWGMECHIAFTGGRKRKGVSKAKVDVGKWRRGGGDEGEVQVIEGCLGYEGENVRSA